MSTTLAAASLVVALSAPGTVKTTPVAYVDATGAALDGIVAWDDATTSTRPGVVVVPDWMGVTPRVEQTARDLAALGYVAFVADIAAWKADLNAADVDWQLVEYADTVHSFTNPDAGTDKSKGAARNERSARRAWAAMRAFFDELFADAAR